MSPKWRNLAISWLRAALRGARQAVCGHRWIRIGRKDYGTVVLTLYRCAVCDAVWMDAAENPPPSTGRGNWPANPAG